MQPVKLVSLLHHYQVKRVILEMQEVEGELEKMVNRAPKETSEIQEVKVRLLIMGQK